MSQIVTIRVVHEKGFIDQECLEKALEKNGFSSEVEIVQVENRYSITMSEEARYQQQQIKSKLESRLSEIVNKILPDYVKNVAIKDFEKQNFRIKEKGFRGSEEYIIFEREKSLREGGSFERIDMTIHQDNTISIENINFSGRSCKNTTQPFENRIGKVIKRTWKEESKQDQVSKQSTKGRERTRIN